MMDGEGEHLGLKLEMVIREPEQHEDFFLKVDGRWLRVTKEVLAWHPGGNAVLTYKNKDASTVFHTFHAGSKTAYRKLAELQKAQGQQEPVFEVKDLTSSELYDVNMGRWDMSAEKAAEVSRSFDRLRVRVREMGLLEGDHLYYARKFTEAVGLILLSFYLQWHCLYVASALVIGLAWQQLGWMIHEYCHHQHFKNHEWNDRMAFVVGNFLQGFTANGWKNQHNVHHAATNVVGRDGDIDLMPFFATVASDLKLLEVTSWIMQMIPYQHIYWTFTMPLLRLSWLAQSVGFVLSMDSSFYEVHRRQARPEQLALLGHWLWVLAQLYCLPDLQTMVMFFLVSQLFGGFLLAHVVTYNHYSTDKFPYNAAILENYPSLQLYTTRNMRPGLFIDWLWGGLNYQVEHHLFPTMPRHNLSKVMPIVQEFCRENDLPYMVDDYLTGWQYEVQQLKNVANIAAKVVNKVREPKKTF